MLYRGSPANQFQTAERYEGVTDRSSPTAIDQATTNVTTTVKAAQVSQPAFWYRIDNEDSTDILSFLKIKTRDPLRSQSRVVHPDHRYHDREYVHRSYSVNGIQFRTIRSIPEKLVPLSLQNRRCKTVFCGRIRRSFQKSRSTKTVQ